MVRASLTRSTTWPVCLASWPPSRKLASTTRRSENSATKTGCACSARPGKQSDASAPNTYELRGRNPILVRAGVQQSVELVRVLDEPGKPRLTKTDGFTKGPMHAALDQVDCWHRVCSVRLV